MNFFSLFKRQLLYKIKKKINIDKIVLNNYSLDELFHYFGSDKANIFKKTNNEGHGFSKFYTKNFNHLINQKIKILEIGSFAGASASAFKHYFKKSDIYCFDINISNFKFSSKNIHVYGVDINNKKKLEIILNSISKDQEIFDIIIDDGSHYLSDILYTFKTLFKTLKRKGIYVIEDYKHPNYYEYNNDIKHIFVDEVIDNIKNKNLFNSKIISNSDQNYLQKKISKIDIYRGNLKDSDICFIEKS